MRLSFGAGVHLENGDWMEVAFEGFGAAAKMWWSFAAKKTGAPVEVQAMS